MTQMKNHKVVCNPERKEVQDRIYDDVVRYFYKILNKQRFEELKKDRPQSKSLVDADCDDLH